MISPILGNQCCPFQFFNLCTMYNCDWNCFIVILEQIKIPVVGIMHPVEISQVLLSQSHIS